MSSINYRPDIDGLRTFAVVPVILFHAGATWMPGGFVGVDIFFVISGYLISSIVLREAQVGEFSFLRFYERRLRRIIPALLVMLLVTVTLLQSIALPDQAQNAAESGVAALFSVSNFYFWRESGYFAPTAEFMPLLHTWSLAVEEQFYLIFPAILLAILKLRLPIRPAILLGTLLAFIFGLWLSVNKPSVAYYLLPARAWELAIGAVLAARAVPQLRGAALQEVVPALGFGMIILAVLSIRSDMIFPGWIALVPCLGAGMVIHAGGNSWVARRILSGRPIVFIGLLSYSLYLWHWPVFAALRIRTANVHLNPVMAAGAILLTFTLAWISWRFVEKPFRDRRKMTAALMLASLGCGSLALLGVAGLSIMTAGFPGRLSEPARIALSAAEDIDPLRSRCEGIHDRIACRFGKPDAPVTYAIIGDSHAAAIRPAVEASGIMGDAAGTLYWTGACPLLDGAELLDNPERAKCEVFKTAIWKEIESNPDLRTIVLAGRWPFQMTGWLPESGGSNRARLVDDETIIPSADENRATLKRSFERTIERLEELGREVIIIGSVPEPGFDVPHTVAMGQQAGLEALRGIRRNLVEDRASVADALLSSVASNHEGIRFVPIWNAFCGKEWCEIERAGVPIYFDDDHLSHSGALEIAAPAIREFGKR